MTTFDKRKDAYESKFVRDEELRFKATARRNKLLGLWTAGRMGRSGDEAESYAREVIRSDMQEAGDEDVLRKVRGDLDAAGVTTSDAELRRKMDELMAEAVTQLEAEAR